MQPIAFQEALTTDNFSVTLSFDLSKGPFGNGNTSGIGLCIFQNFLILCLDAPNWNRNTYYNSTYLDGIENAHFWAKIGIRIPIPIPIW